jgi:hypothetical protein
MPLYFKIAFSIADFQNYEGMVFYSIRNWACFCDLGNISRRVQHHMHHSNTPCPSSFYTCFLLRQWKFTVKCLSDRLCCQKNVSPFILHSSTVAYFANSLKPTETWTVTDQFFSPCYSCTLSWHSELQNSQVCEITSCIPCSFNFLQSNKCAAFGLSSQPHSCIDYSLTLNGFDCFFASYCNSPGVITMVCGNHIGDFLSLLFATETGLQCHAVILLFFSVT